MKVKTVQYKRVFNTGNFSNEQIGVEVEVDEGESVQEVMKQARDFVTLNSSETTRRIAECEHIISNREDYTGRQVVAAQKFLEECDRMMANCTVAKIAEVSGR